jgi:hypothetical protein
MISILLAGFWPKLQENAKTFKKFARIQLHEFELKVVEKTNEELKNA